MVSQLAFNLFAGLWDYIGAFFAIIPKSIYFLFAAVSSCVDAMQALVRKLAGLDTYYVNGAKVSRQDPLSEFVFGILGIGDNSVLYKALNTVFYSLAIFGAIILVVSTIIAIIKSHYGEDAGATDPWKYIYQAIKAIFTFVIVPFVAVVGMKLATFILGTLDQIIAGEGQGGEVTAIYGATGAQKFKYEEIGNLKTYINYDYFGQTSPTTSTTFSGMLFRGAAYSSNRVRTGSVSISEAQSVGGGGIFGTSDSLSRYTSDSDKKEAVASQIDFAFQNCLRLNQSIGYWDMVDQTDVPVVPVADIFAFGLPIDKFSKFDVAEIWLYYNLWAFNFIIAFAGAFSVFSIMISIILGMMSRLITGAALFLVYPALLGLAPMDNFKAFKSWVTQFTSQVLMAIGSIVGINLALLIIPFMSTIEFFNVAIIDAIINIIILIVALMMAKDFIGIVSNFVGSNANALTVGEGKKGAVAGSLKKGVSMTAKAGIGTARVVGAVASKGVKFGKWATSKHRANERRKAQVGLDQAANSANEELKTSQNAAYGLLQGRPGEKTYLDDMNKESRDRIKNAGAEARKKFEEENKDAGLSAKEMQEGKKQAALKAMTAEINDIGINNLGISDSGKRTLLKDSLELVDEKEKATQKAVGAAEKNKEKEKAIADKYGLTKNLETGEWEGKGIKKTVGDKLQSAGSKALGLGKHLAGEFNKSIDSASIGKSMADMFTKSIGEAGAGLGIDKTVKAATEILTPSLRFKGGFMDEKPKLTGDKLAADTAKKQQQAATEQTNLLKQLLTETKASKAATSEMKNELKNELKGLKPKDGSGSGGSGSK